MSDVTSIKDKLLNKLDSDKSVYLHSIDMIHKSIEELDNLRELLLSREVSDDMFWLLARLMQGVDE